MKRTMFSTLWLILLPVCWLNAASPIDRLLTKPDAWFASDEGTETIDNVLAWQSEHGDWPKNVNTTVGPKPAEGKRISGTFDNGATTGELRLLAKAYLATDRTLYRDAFLRGLDHILRAQYPNGGWPQFYPLSDKYHRHITFNDNTMLRLMFFLQAVSTQDDFRFIDSERRRSAGDAVKRAIQCIIDCQIVVDGKLTVWCAQHDAETLAPTHARTYELASLSGAESAGILDFLMRIDEPSLAVRRAVEAGVAWFKETKIEGYSYKKNAELPVLHPDVNAGPLWARFYEIGTNRPIFSDRDGILKYDLSQVGSERRRGYAWYGTWGKGVLESYSRWPFAPND